MLIIRFQRKGKKHQPSYRIVVAERRSKLGAPPVEDLGSYDVFTKAAKVNAERIKHWLQAGARPSDTVRNILIRESVIQGPKAKIKMRIKKKAEAEAAPVAA